MFPCGRIAQPALTRRRMLAQAANGFGAVALSDGTVISAHGSIVEGVCWGTVLIKWDPSTVMPMPATPPRK